MLFNSLEFILFAVAFFAAWPLLRRRNNIRWAYLVVASYLFYGWWDWRFLFLLTFSGLIDYGAGLGMARWPSKRKLLLIASLTGNIGSLGLYKYTDFLIGNLNWVLDAMHSSAQIPLAELALPVGISFYTFQSMSYTIDVYRGQLKPTKNPLHFFAYLALFPQLVAGPIIRASDLLGQLTRYSTPDEPTRWEGCRLIVCGFFKKVVVADTVAATIAKAFEASVPLDSCSYWWVVMGLFAFQIYCDFSGYSDIACGLAKWMGYDFMVNFDHPYISGSFREFWSRWHISLSTWFRDYVYIPLGGSKRSGARSHVNLWITMVTSGFWHGAAWTFAAWGALHAVLLSAERITRWPERLKRLPTGRILATALVFAITLVTWVFFRAKRFDQALAIVAAMFRFHHLDLRAVRDHVHVKDLLVVGLLLSRQVWVFAGMDQSRLVATRAAGVLRVVGVALLVVACIYLRGPGAAFIYFQF